MKKKREDHRSKIEQKDSEALMGVVRTTSYSNIPQMNRVSILAERDYEAGNQDHTYYNISHGTLWGDYDNPTKLLNETCDGNHYDDPTSLDLVPKREKTTVLGRAEGEIKKETFY